MSSRQARINRAITKYGSNVTLNFKPAVQAAGSDGDWPNPDAPPTSPPPSPLVVKAIMVPQQDPEYTAVSEEGVNPTEMVQGFFIATVDLNQVFRVLWQGGEYKILSQDAYELQGAILAQSVMLERTKAPVGALYPHA